MKSTGAHGTSSGRRDHYQEKARSIPVRESADVLVLGGGVAGIGAAIGAARSGAKTILVERGGFLGGVATAGLVAELGGQGGYENISGIAKEIIDDMIALDAANPGRYRCTFDPEYFKYVSLKKLLDEDVEVLFYSAVADVTRDENRVTGAVIESKSGREAVYGRTVVDATGDADAAVRAGAEYVVGRERDGKMRPIGMMFRIGNVDVPKLMSYGLRRQTTVASSKS